MRKHYVEELKKAKADGSAIGAFNIFNYLTAKAAIAAAEDLSRTIILQTSSGTVKKHGVEELGRLLRLMADNARTKVFIHLDHCTSIALAKQCIDNGWDSVMIDNSLLPIQENILITKEITDYAHERNVAVEGELGVIAGVEEDIVSTAGSHANLEDSMRFIQETGVDSFAPSIGTAHGIYTKKPNIDFNLVEAINDTTDCPLVIHGGTGLSGETFKTLIEKGAAKINVSTAIKITYLGSIKEYLQNTPQTEPLGLDFYTFENLKRVVKKHIEMFARRSAANT